MPSLRLRNLVRRNPNRPSLKARAAALKASAARVLRRAPPDPFEGIPCPDGFAPYPTHAPESFARIPNVLRAEGERLLLLALREMERRAPSPETCPDADERRSRETAIRRELRIDALMTLAGRMDPPKGTLPEPGSAAAVAAYDAACREDAHLSSDALTGYPELRRDAVSWWTASCLSRALETGDMTPAEVARLYPLAQERELRIHAAALATNMGALHALAFAEDYPHPKDKDEAVEDEAEQEAAQPDPILAAIDASRKAEAAMQEFSRRTGGRRAELLDLQEEDRLVAAQGRTRDAVWATLPATRAGQLALLDYARFQFGLHGFDPDEPLENDDYIWQPAYCAVAAALAAGVFAEPSPRV